MSTRPFRTNPRPPNFNTPKKFQPPPPLSLQRLPQPRRTRETRGPGSAPHAAIWARRSSLPACFAPTPRRKGHRHVGPRPSHRNQSSAHASLRPSFRSPARTDSAYQNNPTHDRDRLLAGDEQPLAAGRSRRVLLVASWALAWEARPNSSDRVSSTPSFALPCATE